MNFVIKDFKIIDIKVRDYSNDKNDNWISFIDNHRINMDLYENN